MSNLIPASVQVPAHLMAHIKQPSALSASLMGGISSGDGEGYPRISIKGSRFRIVEGGDETVLDTTALDVIVVGANPKLSKTWYAKEWNKDAEPAAPDCFSLDGIKPDASSTDPQNDLCASCPQNAWGSKVTPNGQQVKACSDQKRLAIVAADDPEGPVYLLQVTPSALKGLNAYQKELVMRGIPAEFVKTRITFDTDASYPKLMFGFGGFIDEPTQAVVNKLFGAEHVKQITGEAAVPSAAPALAAPKPAPVEAAPAPVEAAPAPAAPAEAVEMNGGQPEAPKRGFGAKKAAAAPVPKAKPVEEPKAAPTADPAASSLADEIAALVGEVNADDE